MNDNGKGGTGDNPGAAFFMSGSSPEWDSAA
jgi:hypothetical protein